MGASGSAYRGLSARVQVAPLIIVFALMTALWVWRPNCPSQTPKPAGTTDDLVLVRDHWMKGRYESPKPESLMTYNCSKGGNPYCMKGPIEILQEPSQSVSLCATEKPVDIFIMIFSAIENRKRRNNIRQTWTLANIHNSEAVVQYMFVLGTSESQREMGHLERESYQHGDMIQGEFLDTYRNLTLKTILGYTWFRYSCPHARFFMKTDDDTAVNTFSMVKFAWGSMNVGHVMSGQCRQEAQRKPKDQRDRWYMAPDQYPDDTLPAYCCGCGYVVTAHTARDIAEVMPWIPILPIEDLFTGIAMARLPYEVEIRNKPLLFANYPQKVDQRKVFCNVMSHGSIVAIHEFPEGDLVNFFKECAWRP